MPWPEEFFLFGGADQEHSFRYPASEFLKLLGLTQELDDLLQLFFGLFDPGDVLESDFLLLARQQPRTALAEAESLIAAGLHLPHHEDPESEQKDERRSIDQKAQPSRRAGFLDLNDHAAILQNVNDAWIIGRQHRAQGITATLEFSGDLVPVADRDGFDAPRFDLFIEFRVGEVLFTGSVACLDNPPEQDRRAKHHDPKDRCFHCGVHRLDSSATPILKYAAKAGGLLV